MYMYAYATAALIEGSIYALYHLSPVHTNNNVEATFDIVAKTATMSNELIVNFVLSTKPKQIEYVHFVSIRVGE